MYTHMKIRFRRLFLSKIQIYSHKKFYIKTRQRYTIITLYIECIKIRIRLTTNVSNGIIKI